ncbi:hypothetical protein [Streptomyces blastmyceticus]|uniref:hypothetical protein n=1 Tax=Streptomyces blastmyceticus TaxID=68180 RepID=UPI0031E31BCD
MDDSTVPVAIARAGVAFSGKSTGQLLADASKDDDAFAELIRYRAAQWLAAFKLVDPDRGSMGAQTNAAQKTSPGPVSGPGAVSPTRSPS